MSGLKTRRSSLKYESSNVGLLGNCDCGGGFCLGYGLLDILGSWRPHLAILVKLDDCHALSCFVSSNGNCRVNHQRLPNGIVASRYSTSRVRTYQREDTQNVNARTKSPNSFSREVKGG